MTPAIKKQYEESIKNHANQGSPSASWYLLARDLMPHNITKKKKKIQQEKTSSSQPQTQTRI